MRDAGIRDARTGEPWTPGYDAHSSGVIVQAGAQATTPNAATQDLVEVTSQIIGSTALPILNPDPLTLELLFTHSNELGTIEQAVRRKVWRQGLRVKSKYAATCASCGAGADQLADACPKCNATGTMRPPDEHGKLVLEAFLDSANLDRDGLDDVGEDVLADGIRHGRMVAVLRHQYTLNPDGSILTSKLREVRRASPGYMRIVRGTQGRKGGKYFVCLMCRGKDGYRAETEARPCKTCKGVTYDAWYVEVNDWSGGEPRQYFLPNEVYESPLYYRDGTPPALRIWHQAWFFVFANYYARMAFDPRGDKRPDKIIAVLGANLESLRKWLREETDRKRNQPYGASTMAINAQDLTGGQVRADAKVLDLGDETIKGKAIELRIAFLNDLRGQFGISPVDTGDTSSSGGLNNEGLQIRVSAEIVELVERRQQRLLNRVSEGVLVRDWVYAFDHPYEEDEDREAELVAKELENASKAESLSLQVRWEGGRAIIADGVVKAKPMEFAGIPDLGDDEGAGPPPGDREGPAASSSKPMKAKAPDA